MRHVTPLLRAFFALLLFATSFATFAEEAAAVVQLEPVLVTTTRSSVVMLEEFTISKESPSLYRAWAKHDHAYKKAHPWTEVWNANCTRANIPCTPKAWRKLAAGGKFYLPAPVVRIEVASTGAAPEVLALTPTASAGMLAIATNVEAPIVKERQALIKTNSHLADQLDSYKADVAQKSNTSFALGAALFAALVGLIALSLGRKRLAEENVAIKSQLSGLESELEMLRRRANAVPLTPVADIAEPEQSLFGLAPADPSFESLPPKIFNATITRNVLPDPVSLVFERVDDAGDGFAHAADDVSRKYLLSHATEGYVASDWKEGQSFRGVVTRANFVVKILPSVVLDQSVDSASPQETAGREGDIHISAP